MCRGFDSVLELLAEGCVHEGQREDSAPALDAEEWLLLDGGVEVEEALLIGLGAVGCD